MPSPELHDIMSGPEYVGPVVGVKSEYHVFRTARRDFVVFTKSNRGRTSFHVTFVPATSVEALRLVVPGRGTTSGALLKDKRVAEIFGAQERDSLYFEVLTTLYILAAMDAVVIARSGRNLVFTPKALEPESEASPPEEASIERPAPRRAQRRR